MNQPRLQTYRRPNSDMILLTNVRTLLAFISLASTAAAACVIPQCFPCEYQNPPPVVGGQVVLFDDDFIPPRQCHVGPCQPFTC